MRRWSSQRDDPTNRYDQRSYFLRLCLATSLRLTRVMRVLIVGCGYFGLPLGAELVKQGHEVFGLRRSASDGLLTAGITPVLADVTKPESLAGLPRDFDWVVNCVASGGGGAGEYRELYLQGTRNLIEWLVPGSAGILPASSAPAPDAALRQDAGAPRFVYTSSTGVYGQIDGELVTETSPAEPESDTAKVLVETEKVLLAAAKMKKFPAMILRVAGIYGPERGYLLKQYLRNEARIEGRGERILNMIHRDDLIGVIVAALQRGQPGEIYNAADDEPVTQLNFFEWLAGTLGKALPPTATPDAATSRRRGPTNKKVSNQKLKTELRYQFQYPNFRQGYTAEIQRLQTAT